MAAEHTDLPTVRKDWSARIALRCAAAQNCRWYRQSE